MESQPPKPVPSKTRRSKPRKPKPGRKEYLRKGDVLFFSGAGRLIIEQTGANDGAVVAILRGPEETIFKAVKQRRKA